MTPTAITTEQIDVTNRKQLARRVRQLIREGNVRRIVIKNAQGDTVLEVPVTVGVLGLLAAPSVATFGALAAVAAHYTIEVERDATEPDAPEPEPKAEVGREASTSA